MLIMSTQLQMRMIKPYLSSISKILVGRQMSASCRLIILIMVLTAQSTLNSSPRFQMVLKMLPLLLKLKLRCLAKPQLDSNLPLIRPENGARSTRPLMRFQILKFHNHTTSLTSMAIISQDRSGIKVHADLATLCPSLKLLNQDSSSSMERRLNNFLHSS